MKKLITSILFTISITASSQAQIALGNSFPAPSSFGATGKMPGTKGKVVLYDFWASWCVPCRKSFPAYEKLYRKYAKQGFVIVAIGTDKKPAESAKFLKKVKYSFPVIYDHSQRLVAKVRPPGMPSAYLVGKDGKVIKIHSGFTSSTTTALEAEIKNALK
ncbi:TlpA disulfide reductase family protein (plasmid) [Verrucomicrobiaceae bacterium 227]